MIEVLALIASVKTSEQYYNALEYLKKNRHKLPYSGYAYALLYNKKQTLK